MNDGMNKYAAFVGREDLKIFDISDPIKPIYAGRCYINNRLIVSSIAIHDHYAFVVDNNGFVIFDIYDPTNPKYTGRYDTDGYARDIAIQGNYAFVANGDNGVPCQNVIIKQYQLVI